MFAKIKDVKVLDNYRVFLQFEDGTKGEADFSDFPGKGIFADWLDYEQFKKVAITHRGRVLEWSGERDFCADSLYQEITAKA